MNKSRLLALVLFVTGIACFGLYYLMGDSFSNVTVTFDSQGGSSVASQTIKKGERVSQPVSPTKDNSEFVEWLLNGSKYDFTAPVNENIILAAKWNDFKNYKVTVKLDEIEYTADVKDGETLTLESLNIPPKDGYKIILYQESGEEYFLDNKVTSDLNLTAKYVKIETFTVTFNSNGGSKVENAKVETGGKVSEPVTTRDGYDLDGWYLGEEKFDFNTPITKNITLKAKWIEKGKINVIFMVDDKVYKTIPVKENTKVSKPTNPTKKGYKFVEWQLSGSAFDFNTKITSETTLTALFEEVQTYTVTFNSDGGSSVKTQDVEVGKKATKPTDPTKKDYVFKEWQLNGKTYDFNKEVTEDLALKAVWEKAKPKYTVKFLDKDGKEISDSQIVEEGSKATKPTNPTKEGKIFEEWIYNNLPFDFTSPITKDITLTARYRDPKEFTVTFDTGEGSAVNPQTVIEGNKAVRPSTNPSLSGSRFVEWQLDGKQYDFNNKVTKNITLTAKWEKLETNNPDVEE